VLRCEIVELTATSSPSSPMAVIAFARKLTLVNVGFAATDIRIGVEEQLLIATSLITGFEVPYSVRPWPASESTAFETPIELFVICTRPSVPEFVPNLSRQYWIEPVAPWANATWPQSPRAGAVIEPLLFVSFGEP